MPLTAFPSILAGDMPLLNVHAAMLTSGKVFFVDSVTGSNNNDGRDPGRPFATINHAFANGKVRANMGDMVFALPGHVETISAAGSLTLSVAGVRVFGLGQGRTRPVLDFTATAGTVVVSAANCRLSNFIVRANVSAVVLGIDVNANDFEFDNNAFSFDATGDDFVTMLDVTEVDRTYIHDNSFFSENAAGGAEAINLTDTEDVRIMTNVFRGNWSDAIIQCTTTLSARLIIHGNIGYNSDTSNYNGIDTGTLSTTGIVSNNRITALYATAVAKIYRDGDLTSHDNFWANDVSERAVNTLPATTSA